MRILRRNSGLKQKCFSTSPGTPVCLFRPRRSWTTVKVVQSQAGVGFDTAPLFAITKLLRSNNDPFRQRYVVLRLGYLYSTSFEESIKSSHENRAVAAVTLRFPLRKDLLLSHRSEGEFRFFKNQFAPRYRGKLQLDWDTRIARGGFTPYASVEGFYDTRFDAISRWEYSAGIEVPLARHLKLVPYYTYQGNEKTRPSRINVGGLTVNAYF